MANGNCDVSIILINYKTSSLVFDVVRSIKSNTSGFTYEIIVVDNSNDINEFAKLQPLKTESVRLIDARANLGFGNANNLGAKSAKGKYLYFLNTDTQLINNAIFELKKYLDDNENVGIVGSNLYTTGMKPNHSFDRYEKNLRSEKQDCSIKATIKRRFLIKRDDFNHSEKALKLNGCVVGASMMIRKELFDVLGGFDKNIFMYAEESLLCYRLIHELHKEIYNVPSSKIVHFEGGSQATSTSYEKAKAWLDGTYIYYKKVFGEEAAFKFLKDRRRFEKRKHILFKLLLINDKAENHLNWYKACADKFCEVMNNGCGVDIVFSDKS